MCTAARLTKSNRGSFRQRVLSNPGLTYSFELEMFLARNVCSLQSTEKMAPQTMFATFREYLRGLNFAKRHAAVRRSAPATAPDVLSSPFHSTSPFPSNDLSQSPQAPSEPKYRTATTARAVAPFDTCYCITICLVRSCVVAVCLRSSAWPTACLAAIGVIGLMLS